MTLEEFEEVTKENFNELTDPDKEKARKQWE